MIKNYANENCIIEENGAGNQLITCKKTGICIQIIFEETELTIIGHDCVFNALNSVLPSFKATKS